MTKDKEWQYMPEYKNKKRNDPEITATFKFRNIKDYELFKDLVKEFIGVDISKQHQSSDFGGELSTAQIKYCANDVIYLHKINDALNKMLTRENRINLYKDCLKYLNTRVNLDLECFPDDIWSH